MRRESKKFSLWQRFGALVMAAALVLGMVPVTGTAASADIGTINKIEDPETLTRPQEIYGANTLNAGKITVGKSVSRDAITVDGINIALSGANNFLVTMSQSAQAMGLSSETSVPVDVVFVLDTSGSMAQNGRAQTLVTAANAAIQTLMAANANNRVAVVAFSSEGSYGGGTSGGAAANVLSSLGHYSGEAATKHLQWVDSDGDISANGGYIAGRDETTYTTSGNGSGGNGQTKKVFAFRNGKNGGTNIQAGIAAGAKILTEVDNTTYTDPETNETVTRIPFLIVISDGQPTFVYDDDAWYNPTTTGNNAAEEIGPGSGAYEGNGFIAALTAAYYKGKITEHYYGNNATNEQRCFVYTMGVEIEALEDDEEALAQLTLDPATYTAGNYATGNSYFRYGNTWNDNSKNSSYGWNTYWNSYVNGNAFTVRVDRSGGYNNVTDVNYTFTADSIAASKPYVNGVGYTGGLVYNDDYFAATDVDQLEDIFEQLIRTIQEKAISSPTRVDSYGDNFSGYVTFTDPLGEYMELKSMKGIMVDGVLYRGNEAAQLMASGSNAAYNAYLRNVLKTRLSISATDQRFSGEAELNAFVESLLATANGNSITWWGSEYHTGEEDVQVQVLAPAANDSIAYITSPTTEIPAGADYVCRSYFFGNAERMDYLAYVVRVQRSLTAPYQQTVVISAPASLLSVEKVLIHESVDDNGNTVYTASVEEAAPTRVVYEVGLWDTINEENVESIVLDAYEKETVNGAGQKNVTVNSEGKRVYHFFTNDWNRSEAPGSHHRPMAKATFDAAADNGFYTYQENTLIVNANGDPVSANPTGTTAYYVREYYDWANTTQSADGTYRASKKTEMIRVDIPSGTQLVNENGKWYIPKGAYTAATLIVNGDDTTKRSNDTNTSAIVAHPHRTGDVGNSHYTVLLGNNGSISLVSDPPEPTKTVSNVTTGITDANGKSVMVGDVLEYKVTAKNYNADPGTLVITDTVPAGTELVSVNNDGVHADGKITWTFRNVLAGEEKTVSFRVRVTADALDNAVVSSTIQNTAEAKLNDDPTYYSNTTSNPPQGKKVTIQTDATGSSVQVGDILQYFIEFHNDTGAVAPLITIVDTLPAGTDFVTADHNGRYDPQNHTVTWTFENVGAGFGGVVSCSVQVNASAKTDIENSAQIKIGNHTHTTNTTTTTLDKGNLTLKKTVVIPNGLTPSNDTFTLTLTDPSGKLNGTYSGVSFTNGIATVQIQHNQTITIEGLAAGTTIRVSETVPAGFRASISGNGQAVIPVNGTATVAVENTYAVSSLEVLLQGNKTLTGGSPDNETFGFTVVPCDGNGVATGAAGITGEVTLTKDTKAITFGKLAFAAPGTFHYLVSEVNGGQTGVTYTQTQYLVTIVVADNGNGTLSHTMTVQSRPDSNSAFADFDGTMLFTNAYKPLDTSVTFEGTKTLTGRTLKPDEFSFVVTENGNVVSTGSNNENGKISFRPITYTEAGTHTYVITEQAGNLPGVTYSQDSYTVTVEVRDVNGQLVATVTGADSIAFVNTFKPKEVAVTLEANKELTGASLKDSQFSFIVNQKDGNGDLIKDSSGNPVIVASGSNDANGKITFSKIEYFLEDMGGATSKIFQYQITELVPDSGIHPSMFYDRLVIDVSVEVTYNPETGVLSVGDPVYSADTTFNNIDNPDTIPVVPQGSKTVNSKMPAGARFSFSVVDVDSNALVASGVSNEDGTVTFSGITYDYNDLGGAASKVFRYWITEDQGGTTSAGISYDPTKYLMVVTLSKTSTNALDASVEYFTLAAGAEDVAANYTVSATKASFTNTYEVTEGTSVTMEVTKALQNLKLTAGMFEFGLYHNGNLVATATNDAAGKVTFTRVYAASILAQYDTNGDGEATIEYVIKELNNRIPGITYAENEVRVEVLIQDNGQGGTTDPVVTYLDATTFTNTYTPNPIYVKLEADKDLTGRTLEEGEFSFVVLDENDQEVAWATNDATGKILFSDLVYDFGDVGQTFTYTVKEVKPDIGADPNLYYDPSQFTVEVDVTYDQETGTLGTVIRYPADMEFNNVQNPATIPVKPSGKKTVINQTTMDVSELRFSFRVMGLVGTDLNNMAMGAVEATGVSSGSEINFTELVFDNDDVGKTFYYVLEEIATANVNTVEYTTVKYGMSVRIYRDSNNFNALDKQVIYYTIAQGNETKPANWVPFGPGGEVNFVNTIKSVHTTLNIQGTKVMNKTLHGGEFDFRMQMLDENNVPVPGAIIDGVNNADGSITFGTLIFTDKQMDSTNPAQNYVYRVAISEIKPDANAIPGVTYSTKIYIAEIHWSVTEDENHSLIYGQPEVVAIYEAERNGAAVVAKNSDNLLDGSSVKEALTFTNTYSVTTGTTVTMEVTKVLQNLKLTAGKFEFGLYHNGNLVATATNDANGKVTFTRVYAPSVLEQYDTNGDRKATIEYVIKELNTHIPGITYAENEVRVEVLIEDNGQGGMKDPVVTYLDTATFTNTYTPNPTYATLEAQKELTGRDLVAGEFAFVVLDKNNVEVAWGNNAANGQVVFSQLAYTYERYLANQVNGEAIFTYTVKEVVPDVGADPNLYYDPSVFTVDVVVTYNQETGVLSTEVRYPDDMAFNNIQNPATITVQPTGTKSTTGNVPNDTRFSYTIYDVRNDAPVGAGTSGINGEITFSTLVYDSGDVGNTYYYWIAEDNGGSTHAGITYDDAKFLVIVTVGRDATNKLTADVAYYTVAENGSYTNAEDRTAATVAFGNRYQITQPAEVKIFANKTLTGRDLRYGEFGFNLYHLHGDEKILIAATTNGYDDNANVVFFSRTYAPSVVHEHGNGETATIYYVIEEQNNNLGGVDYSHAKPVYVKVVVTDMKDGTMSNEVTYYSDPACDDAHKLTDPTFENTYTTSNEGYTPHANKVLTGRDMVDDEFSFVVTDLLGNPVSYGLSKKAASGTPGAIIFNEITYTYAQFIANKNAQGEAIFRYVISEIRGNLVNVDYDHALVHPIYLEVTVKDLGNGKLKATGEYFSDEAFQNALNETPSFHNSYVAIGTTVTLEANKTLTGRKAVDGEFSFQVLDAQGNVVATGGNYNGAVKFSGIGITADMMNGQLTESFVFKLEELNTNQSAVTFDDKDYYAKVTVKNNLATGKLEVTDVTYFSDETCQTQLSGVPTFINKYEPATAEVSIPIHKDLINHTLKAGMFCFQVKHENLTVAQISNDAQGNAIFPISYHVSQLENVAPNADNVRTKTFTYIITEQPGTADSDDDNGTYTYDSAEYIVVVVLTDDGKGDLTTAVTITKNNNAAEHVVFTNSFTPDPITVDLDTAIGAIKTIVDDEGNVLRRSDVEFHFVVTDLNGDQVTTGTASGANMVDGEMPIDFGTFTFAVEGEYRYRITETMTTLEGYVLDTKVWCTHIQVRYDPNTGKLSVSGDDIYTHVLLNGMEDEGIQSQAGEQPVFVNVYDTEDVQLHLTVNKTMDQDGDRTAVKEHEFLFQLLNEDGTIAAEARNHLDGTVNFYLDYTLQDLNGVDSRTFKYTVKEVIPSGAVKNSDGTYTLDGVTYTTKTETLTVELRDNGAGKLITLVNGRAAEGTVNTNITFKNKYVAQDVQVELHAVKRMDGMPLVDNLFNFVLREGETDKITGTNKADGTIVFDDVLTFTEPGTYTYTMMEIKGTKPGVAFDETSYTVTVVVMDNGRGNLVADVTYTTHEGAYDHPVFINFYKPESTSAAIGANKVLENKDLTAGEFTFQLIDSQGAVISEATNKADGTVTFESQVYHEVGTHTYTIQEVVPEGAVENEDGTYTFQGVTYDPTIYKVVVEVTDEAFDGTLDHTVTYYKGTQVIAASKVVFTNVYATGTTTVDVTAEKELSGKDLTAGEFRFELVNKDDADEVYTAVNRADGSILFEDLVFAETGTYIYELYEVAGSDNRYTYDDTVIIVTVTVADNGDGTLTATVAYSEDAVFHNSFKPDAITVELEGTKELTGRDQKDGEFEFQVKDAEGNVVADGTNKADGTIVFDSITVDAEVEWILYVTEVQGNDTQIEYDDYTYRVKLTVTNENGVLKAAVQYLDGEIVFYNDYEVPETPPTGDETPVFFYMILMGVSAAALVAVLVLGSKKKERKF